MLYQLSYIHRGGAALYTGPMNAQPLIWSSVQIVAALALGACAAHLPGLPENTAMNDELSSSVRAARHMFFDHDIAYGPVVTYDAQTRSQAGVRVTARPVRLEAQPWNVWPDGTARLLNDAQGFAIDVRIDGARTRWDPAHTELAVNTTEQVFPPAPTPDELLTPLLLLTRYEAQLGAPPDAQLRLRNADGFRAAYLSDVPQGGSHAGVIVFPAPAARMFAVAMRVTVGVIVNDTQLEQFTFLFE